MLGYSDNPQATLAVLDDEGWLHTGDLGKLDGRGRLTLVGRAKDVVVSSNGENVYPDDVEVRLGQVANIKELCVLGVADGRGGERLACVYVPQSDCAETPVERGALARASLELACRDLLPVQRPALLFVSEEELPRTSTKKVKRAELRSLFENKARSPSLTPTDIVDELDKLVRATIQSVARKAELTLSSGLTLRGDLGFDSLMALDLLVALEGRLGKRLDGEKLAAAETIGELVDEVRRQRGFAPSRTSLIEDEHSATDLTLPKPLQKLGKSWLGQGQNALYRTLMDANVVGATFIPHNRHTLVVANHASHLDQGLVKYALGSYGKNLMTLAAQDYFFEGKYKKAYFEQLTNLVPMSRSGSLRGTLRQAGDLLDSGKTVLIFPEGTRATDGRLRPFKAAMGHLALRHDVDILPIWLEGTAQALPKGAKLPKGRKLEARIGPVLPVSELKQVTQGLSTSDAARVVTRIAHLAVAALSQGRHLNLSEIDVAEVRRSEVPEEEGLRGVFEELKLRFVQGAVDAPLSYYFSLGEERWTVRATPTDIEVAQGKTVQAADCVLKTSPQLFERIVRNAWVPGPSDFVSGQIKTNNVAHLLSMQKLFRLATPSEKLNLNAQMDEGQS